MCTILVCRVFVLFKKNVQFSLCLCLYSGFLIVIYSLRKGNLPHSNKPSKKVFLLFKTSAQ